MEHIVNLLQSAYPQLTFTPGKAACWSPRDKHIHYIIGSPYSIASLFHELAHALLNHTGYQTDLELLHKEIAAWEQATVLAAQYDHAIDPQHIQDCLDTYRDWLHKRSACPSCHMNGLQSSLNTYDCLNCGQQWQVSSSRFCRAYRRAAHTKKSQGNALALSRFI